MNTVKTEKFKLNKEFKRLYGRGKSFVDPLLVTYVLKSGRDHCRIGITVGKKLGGAVERNRAKRVKTAAWRETAPLLSQNVDAVFVARTRILSAKSGDVAAAMIRHFKKSGLIPSEKTER